MTDKTQEFLELLERIKNRKHGDNIDKIMEEMHEMLPAVEKNVLRDAAKICSLGFDPFILVQTADFVAVANGNEDKKLEYRARELEKEIDLFHKLDLFPENNEEDSETCFFISKMNFTSEFCKCSFQTRKCLKKYAFQFQTCFLFTVQHLLIWEMWMAQRMCFTLPSHGISPMQLQLLNMPNH